MRSTGELAATLLIFYDVLSASKKCDQAVPLDVVLSFWAFARGISRRHALLTLALLDEKDIVSLSSVVATQQLQSDEGEPARQYIKWAAAEPMRRIMREMDVGTLVPSLRDDPGQSAYNSTAGGLFSTPDGAPPAMDDLFTNVHSSLGAKKSSGASSESAKDMLQRIRQQMEDVKFGNDTTSTDFRFPTEVAVSNALSEAAKAFLETLNVAGVYVVFNNPTLLIAARRRKSKRNSVSNVKDEAAGSDQRQQQLHRQVVEMYRQQSAAVGRDHEQQQLHDSARGVDAGQGGELEGDRDHQPPAQCPIDWFLDVADDGYFFQHIEEHVRLCCIIDGERDGSGSFGGQTSTACPGDDGREQADTSLLHVTFEWRLRRYLAEHPAPRRSRSSIGRIEQPSNAGNVSSDLPVSREVGKLHVEAIEHAAAPDSTPSQEEAKTEPRSRAAAPPAASHVSDSISDMISFFSQRSRVVAFAAAEKNKQLVHLGSEAHASGGEAKTAALETSHSSLETLLTTTADAARARRRSSLAVQPDISTRLTSFVDCCREASSLEDAALTAIVESSEKYAASVALGLLHSCLADMTEARRAVVRFALECRGSPCSTRQAVSLLFKTAQDTAPSVSALPLLPNMDSAELATLLVDVVCSQVSPAEAITTTTMMMQQLGCLIAQGHSTLFSAPLVFNTFIARVLVPIDFSSKALESDVIGKLREWNSVFDFNRHIEEPAADGLAARIISGSDDAACEARIALRRIDINSRSAAHRYLAAALLGRNKTDRARARWAACVLDDLVTAYWVTHDTLRANQIELNYPTIIASFINSLLAHDGVGGQLVADAEKHENSCLEEIALRHGLLGGVAAVWSILPDTIRTAALGVQSLLLAELSSVD